MSAPPNNSNFSSRLILSFGLLISIVVCLGLVGLNHLHADAELEEVIDARWSKVQLSRNALALSSLNNRITMQVFLIEDENELDSLLKQRGKNTEEISKLLATLRSKVESSEEVQLLDVIDKSRTPYVDSYQRALHLLIVDKKQGEARTVLVQEALPRLLRYHAAWNAYGDYQGNQLDQAQNAAGASYFTTRIEAYSLILLAIFLAIAIAFFVTRNLTRHMARPKQAEEALRQAHAQLEMRVRERTSQLAATNESLQKEIDVRKPIEDKLRASEDRYRQIVDGAKDMIYRLTPAGHFTFVNPAAAATVKRSAEECAGLHFLSLVRRDFRESAIQFYQQQVVEKIPVTYFEFPAMAKDATEIWVGQNVQLQIEDGEVVELQAVGRDITTRKEVEERLLESERRYRMLFESNPHPMWVFDVETLTFLAVNDAAVLQYGYSREEFLGMTIRDIRSKGDIPALYERKSTLTDGGGSYEPSFSWRHQKKDGSIIDVEITWHTLDFAGRPAKLVLANDITERKRAEEALAQERILLRTVIDNLPDAVYVKDAAGHKVLANRADLENIGKPEDEVLGKTDRDVFPTDVAAQFDADDQSVLHDGQAVINREELLVNAAGQSRWLLTSKLPLRDNQGCITGLVGIGHDITESLIQTARFQQLFDNAPMGILRVDQNDIVLDANKKFETIFQFSLSEMQGRPISEIVVPKAHGEEGTALSSRVLGGEIIDLETVRQRKDGTLIPVQIYGVPIVVSEKPVGVFAIYVDLSERKRAQERITLLAEIVESSDDAIIGKDLEGTIASWNQGAQTVYGYRAEEVVGRSISVLVPPDRSDELTSILELIERGQGVRLNETERLTKDGTRICVSLTISPIKDPSGRVVGASTIARDITERKRMEEERQTIFGIIHGVNATRDLDELLGLIHKSIGQLLYAENCFVALHDPATDLLNFEFWVDKFDSCPAPHPVGIGFSSYVLRTGKSLLLDRELTERMYQSGEVEKSGSPSASWLGVPLRTQSGTIGVLVVQHYEDEHAYDERDLEFLESVGNQVAIAIGRKRAETNLRETEEQLRQSQKMESIGTLAGGIAHDFNNLMTAVTGYSELALRHLDVEDPLRPKIEEIKKAGERAATLTRQLLAFSRKQILQPRVLDLNTVITGMGKMLTRVIGEEFDLKIELEASLGQVEADPGQVEQIILNLAVNARDAMPNGGYLTIKTDNVYFDAKFSQRRSVVEPGHYVMLSVSDNGCGMDVETQKHIFEPFFTTKEVDKGTGLGLSTVYGIVKQSGGSIWVYSEVGRGTTFKIYLPRVDDVVDAKESWDKARSAPRGSETILLVEDEDMVRDLSREILEEYGYAVITAPNGKEGLRICEEFEGQIDLMITDVVMPQMSGRELAENVGTVRPGTRVLYMSGFTDDAVVRHGVLDDGMCFIQKPFSPDSLALKAREVLDQVEAR